MNPGSSNNRHDVKHHATRCIWCDQPVSKLDVNYKFWCQQCHTFRYRPQDIYQDLWGGLDPARCYLCGDPLTGSASYRSALHNYNRHFICPCITAYKKLNYGETMKNVAKLPRLGKKLPKIDHRTLKLSKYTTKLPPPPDDSGYVNKVTDWGMMLNDSCGCCTVAAAGHDILQWTTYAGKAFKPSDSQILHAYQAVSGYNPNDPSTDNGAVVLDVMKYWRKNGIGGHKIGAFVAVNPKDPVEIKQAVSLFGNCYIGVGLPIAAQDPIDGENGYPCWSVPRTGPAGDGAPYSWGGHAVTIVGYGADTHSHKGVELITWGQVYDATWGWLNLYCDEAYAMVSSDWLKEDGTAPNGFNIQQLADDLQVITQ
jgi:hypothetical protein